MSDLQENYTLKQYLQEIIANDVEIFNTLIKWGEGDIQEFKQLLEILESPYDKSVETTKQKGDRLENLVEFIIRKSYFFEVYKNVHTETNEIDEIIVYIIYLTRQSEGECTSPDPAKTKSSYKK